MNGGLDDLAWPPERLGEGIETLARRAGLAPLETALTPPPALDGAEAWGRWIEWAADRLGLEAEAVDAPLSEFEGLPRGAAPAVFWLRDGARPRFLLALRARGSRIALIGPDLRVRERPLEALRATLCAPWEAPLQAEIRNLLELAGIPEKRRAKVRAALLRERLAGQRLDGCWMLRLPPTAEVGRQLRHARAWVRLGLILPIFAALYGVEILGWSLLGQGALAGRLDWGWLAAWALLICSTVPLSLLGHWLEAWLALDIGRALKQRLLAGALQMDLDTAKRQGAGQALGCVIESQALESLSLNGGLNVSVAAVELAFAAWILASGAGGALHAVLLPIWLLVAAWLVRRYFRRLGRWTAERLNMTQDLVERMVGHRTCLAQEPPTRRNLREDAAMERFLSLSQELDRAAVPVFAFVPRGWMLLGLLGLTPAFVAGSATPASLAIALGGMLLAARALGDISGGLAALARAAVAWKPVAPLFDAACRPPAAAPFLNLEKLSDAAGPLIDAEGLNFRYRAQGAPVLRDAALKIERGEHILLEGRSGGGKSTLAALLAGLRQPDSGLLLLHGLDRHTLGDNWRRLATSAPQFHENHIFAGSLAFNLLMGRRWPPTEEDLREAEDLCQELGLGDLLERMPAGLMQRVGETGWRLSHGERGRVYLARALLQNASLTVLDESFAALDPETLEQSLDCALRRARTLMVIAHP